MKVLTANRLTDGDCRLARRRWRLGRDDATAPSSRHDKAAEARLEAIGSRRFADNEVVDVNLIDVEDRRRRHRVRCGCASASAPPARPTP